MLPPSERALADGCAAQQPVQPLDALETATKVVTKFRAMAQAGRVYLPYLATSLDHLGRLLNALGRRDEALALIEEAETIRRTLADRELISQVDFNLTYFRSNHAWFAANREASFDSRDH